MQYSYEGKGFFTNYSLWNNLLSMLENHEAEVNEALDGIIEKSEPLGGAKLRASLQEVRNAFPKLFQSSQSLVSEGVESTIDTARIEDVLEALVLEQALKELFQCDLARDVIHDVPPAADRARELLTFVTHAKPGRVAQRYLSRVARCFTWGYEAETFILCRSVLEQVLEEAVPDSDVFTAFAWKPEAFPLPRRKVLAKKDAFGVAIGDRIHAARVLGKLTEEDADFAKLIRDRGDKAVHDAPDSGADITGTVQGLTNLISKLCDPS